LEIPVVTEEEALEKSVITEEEATTFMIEQSVGSIIWVFPSSSFYFRIGNIIDFFTLVHKGEGKLPFALSYKKSTKYTPMLVKANSYA
jgi:hypothetical protein